MTNTFRWGKSRNRKSEALHPSGGPDQQVAVNESDFSIERSGLLSTNWAIGVWPVAGRTRPTGIEQGSNCRAGPGIRAGQEPNPGRISKLPERPAVVLSFS